MNALLLPNTVLIAGSSGQTMCHGVAATKWLEGEKK
jgi:hypothetical protein